MTGSHALEPGGAATEMMMGEEPGGLFSNGSREHAGRLPSRAELELLAAAPPPPPPPPPSGKPKRRSKSRSGSSSRRDASNHLHIHPSKSTMTSSTVRTGLSSDPPSSTSPSETMGQQRSPASYKNNPSSSPREPSPREASPAVHHIGLQEPQEPSPTSTYQIEPNENVAAPQQEPSPTMVQKPQDQPVSPLTARTEELSNNSSPNNKEDDRSPAEKGQRNRRELESLSNQSMGTGISSVDPPTGNDHKGRAALDATPTAAQLNEKASTPSGNSQAHYDAITNARHNTIHGGLVLPQQPGPSLTHASPTASSLATEPHSNAQTLTQQQLPKNVMTRGIPGRQSRNELDASLLPPQHVQKLYQEQRERSVSPPPPPPQVPSAHKVVVSPTPKKVEDEEEPIIKPQKASENIVSLDQKEKEQPTDSKTKASSSSEQPPSVVLVNNRNNDPEKENSKSKKKRGGFLGKIFKRGGRNKKDKESKTIEPAASASQPASESTPMKETSARIETQKPERETKDDRSMVTYHEGVTVKSSSTKEGGGPTVKSAPELNEHIGIKEEAFDAFADEDRFAAVSSPNTASPPNSSKARPEISFLHDDVSTLTGPTFHTDTRRKSRDPAEAVPNRDQANNEPVGHYFNFDLDEAADVDIEQRPSIDPFEQPFFQPEEGPQTSTSRKTAAAEPTPTGQGAKKKKNTTKEKTRAERRSPPSTKSAKGSNLADLQINTMTTIDSSVGTPSPTDDPMGDFATQSASKRIHDPSPRGYKTPEATNYPDPIGESPLHKHERGPVGLMDGHVDSAPDPPLYLTSVPSNDSSSEEGDAEKVMHDSLGGPDDETGPGPFPTEKSYPVVTSQQLSGAGTVGAMHPTSFQLSIPASSSMGSTASENVIAAPPAPMRQAPPPPPRVENKAPPPPPPTAPTQKTDSDLDQRSCDVQKKNTNPPSKRAGHSAEASNFDVYGDTRNMEKAAEREPKPTRSVSATRQRPRPEGNQFRRNNMHISTEPNRKETNALRDVAPSTNASPRKSSAAVLREALREAAKEKEAPQVSPTESTSSEHSMYDADTGEKLNQSGSSSSRRRRTPLRRRHHESAKEVSPKEASPSPKKNDGSAGSKLMISSMARMNAKAVAYLHTLNGEPSPRNAWPKPIVSMDEEVTPASQTRGRNSFASSAATEVSTPGNDDTKRFFRAYSGKFKGRKLATKAPTPRSRLPKKEVRFTDKDAFVRVSAATQMNRNVDVSGEVVSMGFAAFRYRREMDIYSGKSKRIVPQKKKARTVPQQKAEEEHEPLDPIQRAGRRLLAKAAVPIQASARRYLAQKEAVDRMWALIEIQSYMRRWRAEANLLACSLSAVTIQRMIRGYLHFKHYCEAKDAAIEIQRIVRGHLASAWAFDTVYSAIVMQSLARRFLTQTSIMNQSFSAILFQSAFRGYVQRKIYLHNRKAATQIQTFWRSQEARIRFKCTLIDVIIVQNVARMWFARKRVSHERNMLELKSCTLIQKMWRGHHGADNYKRYRASQKIQSHCRLFVASNKYKKYKSASKIQAAWRGFQGYTDYIFYLVDVLLVQRVARRWLAVQEANRRRRTTAATKIQSCWRSFSAQFNFVRDLADIIRVQSVARMCLACTEAHQRKVDSIEQNACATRIQAAWRGFWEYSHHVIMLFEVTKLQALARGVNTRKHQQFRLGCCILIQAAARRYLAQRSIDDLVMERVFTASKALEMRERLSAERIQFWWSVVLECRREKEAALTIEKFFIMVKAEVEKEIRRQEKRKQEKREKRRQRKKKDRDDKVLERVWLNTVDDGNVDIIAYSASQSTLDTPASSASSFTTGQTPRKAISTMNLIPPGSTKSSKTMMSPNVRHRSTSPSMSLVMRHEFSSESGGSKELLITDTKNIKKVTSSASSSRKPKPIMTASNQASPVPSSGMDSLAFSKSEYSEDSPSSSEAPSKLGLASPVFDSKTNPSANSKDKINKYMNMYGLKSGSVRSTGASSATPKSTHFFAGEDVVESSNGNNAIESSSLPEVPAAPTHKSSVATPLGGESHSQVGSATPTSLVKGLNVNTDNPSEYQKALLAAAKASISNKKPTSPSPRHGKMLVMDRYLRDKPQTPSQASGSDDSSFLAGEEFGMI